MITAAEIGVEILGKFQDDLIRYAEANWEPDQVRKLREAIDCVCKGEKDE